MVTDRLGSVRAYTQADWTYVSYFPFGEERTSTADGTEKFGTYFRDGPGQDYAEQRYYNNGTGRFWGVDPGGTNTVSLAYPLSWNQYAYVGGDPVNFTDPHGLFSANPCWVDPSQIGCDPIAYMAGGGFAYGQGYQPVGTTGDPGGDGGGGGEGITPPSTTSPPPPQFYVVAAQPCYTLNLASAKGKPVWELDIDYSAYEVTPSGTTIKLTGNSQAVIQEHISQAPTQTGTPGAPSASLPGQVFQDQISAGVTGPFQATQTFTVVLGGVPYNASIQSFTAQVTASNVLSVGLTNITVNGEDFIPTSGRNRGKRPLCSGGYEQ